MRKPRPLTAKQLESLKVELADATERKLKTCTVTVTYVRRLVATIEKGTR